MSYIKVPFFSTQTSVATPPKVVDTDAKDAVPGVPISMSKAVTSKTRRPRLVAASDGLDSKKGIGSNTCSQEVSSLERPLGFSLRDPDNMVYSFVLSQGGGLVNSSSSVEVDSGIVVLLSNLANYTDFSGVFDQYRIDYAELIMIPRIVPTSSAANMGQLATVVDYDNATSQTFAALTQYGNVQISSGANGRRIRFVPHLAVATYSGTFTSFANMSGVWIDSAYPNVQHYGVKYAWTATDAVYSYDFDLKVKVSFRNVI